MTDDFLAHNLPPDADYEESEGLEFMDRPLMGWRGIVSGLAITALFVAAFVGFAVISG